MKFSILIITLFGAITLANAQVQLDKSVLMERSTHIIDVYLTPTSVPGWNDLSNWTVIAIDGANNVSKVELASIKADSDNTMFSLIPANTGAGSPIATATQVVLRYGARTMAIYQVPAPGGGEPPATAPGTKQNSDLYLNFSFSPRIHSAPQYTIDVSLGMMWDLDKQNWKKGQLGFVGSVKTDKRKKVDPDSYRAFLAYQNTPLVEPVGKLQGIMFTWLTGSEFDHKADNVNFITAPYLDFPIRLLPKEKTIRATTKPLAVFAPLIGFEAGHNFHNALNPHSSGILRSVTGASMLFHFNPKLPALQGIEINAAYTLRLPLKQEIYTLTKSVDGQDVDDPFLGKNPRHYAKVESNFKFTDAFAFTIKYEYGAIPPAFRKQDHKVTVGFTYSIRQLMNGVPSALRNK
jgi:hypothetical protein